MAGDHAQEQRGKRKHATSRRALLMAAGQVGVYGQAAGTRVMLLGHKEDHGAARIHDLEMAGNLVRERPMNNACVSRTHVRLTVVGQVGVDGLHARKFVELVHDNVLEAARDRLLVTVGNLALEVDWKDKCATNNLARFTVVGQVGVHGIPVINPVEPVFKSVLGVVRAPRLVLAGNHAKEQRGKITSVIRMRVQLMAVGQAGLCRPPVALLVAVE